MFCRKCGKEIDDNALFCTGCGARVLENEKVNRTNTGKLEREKVFRAKPMIGIIYFAVMAGCLVVAVSMLYEYSELSPYFYPDERRNAFLIGIATLVFSVEFLVLAIGRMKVKLCVGMQSVSGIASKGLLVGEFECFYDEISEVSCMLGCVQIRANGRFIILPALEDGQMAKQMIEQRISKH